MNKLFAFTILILSSLFNIAQEQKPLHRVILESDNIPVFEKNYPGLNFGPSFFYTTTVFTESVSISQFNQFKQDVELFHSDIKIYISQDNLSVVAVFPKHATKGVTELKDFLNSYMNKNNFPGISSYNAKHIQVVREYGVNDKNKGFN